ncbi:HipA domain-containing protein [Sphingobacterium sp. BS-2]|uniref:HipA domain-containing protein n=1 Tax=Sphingobacterium sp. BS-2 TaxID=3377129 RepID=UPI0038FC7AA6
MQSYCNARIYQYFYYPGDFFSIAPVWIIKVNPASDLDIVEFLQGKCRKLDENCAQFWLRIVFNIAVSNKDDHIRNRGFVLGKEGWTLSPAYDFNPSIDKAGLALKIDMHNRA